MVVHVEIHVLSGSLFADHFDAPGNGVADDSEYDVTLCIKDWEPLRLINPSTTHNGRHLFRYYQGMSSSPLRSPHSSLLGLFRNHPAPTWCIS